MDLERYYAELGEQKRRCEEMMKWTHNLLVGIKQALDDMRSQAWQMAVGAFGWPFARSSSTAISELRVAESRMARTTSRTSNRSVTSSQPCAGTCGSACSGAEGSTCPVRYGWWILQPRRGSRLSASDYPPFLPADRPAIKFDVYIVLSVPTGGHRKSGS